MQRGLVLKRYAASKRHQHLLQQPFDFDNQETLKTIYYSLVQPYFDYCDVVWGDCSKTRADKLQKLQNTAARIITRADYSIRSSAVLNSLEWSNLEEREKKHLLIDRFRSIKIQFETKDIISRLWGINIRICMSLFPRASR